MSIYIVGSEVLYTAFEKNNSEFGFSLTSFRMARSLGMRYFVWIWMISVSPWNIGQFLEKAWWSTSQWKHLTSVLVCLSLLCPWLLHLAHFANVSQYLFTVCPYLRLSLQLIGLS